jgi:multisubunit Na+/H+ antiporter MnhB subunit
MTWVVVLAVAALCVAVFLTIAATPAAPGLEDAVAAALPASGVTNPVTGVLLDYRGYDTFLEVMIVALAVMAGAALAPRDDRRSAPLPPLSGPVARGAAAALAPVIVLAAGYLLWAGSGQPGGAFQAGATLAGGLILLDATGDPRPFWRRGLARRAGAALGPLAFLAAGLATMGLGRGFLDYPDPAVAYAMILSIEGLATLSIAMSLAALFAAEPLEAPR